MAEVKLTVSETKLAIISPKSLVATANTTTYATEGEIQEANGHLIHIAN